MNPAVGNAVQASIEALPQCMISAIEGRRPFCVSGDHVEFSATAMNGAPLAISVGKGGWAIIGRGAWFETKPGMVRHIEPAVTARQCDYCGRMSADACETIPCAPRAHATGDFA